MFAARAGSAGLSLGTYAILSRILPPSDMGAYFLASSVVCFGAIFASHGLKDAAVRLISESMGRRAAGEIRRAVVVVLELGVCAVTLTALLYMALGHFVALSLFHQETMALATGLIAIWIAMAGLQGIAADIFRGLQDYGSSALFSGPPSLASAGILFPLLLGLLIFSRSSTFGTVLRLATASSVSAVVIAAGLLLPRLSRLPRQHPRTYRRMEVLNLAWPLLVSNLLIYIIGQADLWVVGIFRSQQEVAVYGAAWRLAQLVALPVAIANAVVPPMIAQLHAQGDRDQLESLLRRSATWGAVPALCTALLAFALGGPILRLVYGGFYSTGSSALTLLSVGQVMNVSAGSSGFTLMMTGNEKTMMSISAICSLLFAAGELMAVPSFGINGAASVAAGTMILQNVLMLISVKKRVGIWTHARLFPVRP